MKTFTKITGLLALITPPAMILAQQTQENWQSHFKAGASFFSEGSPMIDGLIMLTAAALFFGAYAWKEWHVHRMTHLKNPSSKINSSGSTQNSENMNR